MPWHTSSLMGHGPTRLRRSPAARSDRGAVQPGLPLATNVCRSLLTPAARGTAGCVGHATFCGGHLVRTEGLRLQGPGHRQRGAGGAALDLEVLDQAAQQGPGLDAVDVA